MISRDPVINRTEQTLSRIRSILDVHERLGCHATKLNISVENATIVLSGELPTQDLRGELLPTIRQAGVLWRVSNRVEVAA